MNLTAAIRDAYRGRPWQWRLLLLAWLVFLGIKHFKSPIYVSPFEWLDVVIHEVGHPLFGYFGEFMHVAGGTILQLAVPVIALGILLKQGEFFGAPLCGVWLADNLYGIARYIADTQAREGDY